jgi:Zn-dependent M28 family amino/carboxypeptidase
MDLEQVRSRGGLAKPGDLASPEALKADVAALAVDIGERNLRDDARYRRLLLARDFIATRFSMMGLHPRLQRYEAAKREAANIEVELRGREHPEEIVVVGAHYDTAPRSPGANDNATGVAALLALARAFSWNGGLRPSRTLRLLAFSTEEPPFTHTPRMGSAVYARRCRDRRERVVAMLSLETLGYYFEDARRSEAPFPLSLVPAFQGDFVAVVGNLRSRALVRQVEAAFPEDDRLRCHGVTLPGRLWGVRSSDHRSFWKEGYPAVMVTDTAFLRYRHYHRPTDTIDRLSFAMLARAVTGLGHCVRALTGAERSHHG